MTKLDVPNHRPTRASSPSAGVIGGSVACPLAHTGCTDAAMIERHQLTAGATSHSASARDRLDEHRRVSTANRYRGVDVREALGEIFGADPLRPGSVFNDPRLRSAGIVIV